MDDAVVEVPHQNKMMLPSTHFIQQGANRDVVIGAKNITIWSSIAHTYVNSVSALGLEMLHQIWSGKLTLGS